MISYGKCKMYVADAQILRGFLYVLLGFIHEMNNLGRNPNKSVAAQYMVALMVFICFGVSFSLCRTV